MQQESNVASATSDGRGSMWRAHAERSAAAGVTEAPGTTKHARALLEMIFRTKAGLAREESLSEHARSNVLS